MNILSINIKGVSGGAKASWVKELKAANKISAIAIAIQETKVDYVSNAGITGF